MSKTKFTTDHSASDRGSIGDKMLPDVTNEDKKDSSGIKTWSKFWSWLLKQKWWVVLIFVIIIVSVIILAGMLL